MENDLYIREFKERQKYQCLCVCLAFILMSSVIIPSVFNYVQFSQPHELRITTPYRFTALDDYNVLQHANTMDVFRCCQPAMTFSVYNTDTGVSSVYKLSCETDEELGTNAVV
jgi:hypothetical protein